jgi:type IV pilus assembly protein PilC
VYRDIIGDMYQSIRVGDPIYKSLSDNERVPKMFSAMFRIGEQTGELSSMVDKLADFYEEEVSTAVKSLTSILEPMMIVIVAGVVAVILVAMYLPMFNMMSTVS